jgi:hypothetical protein
MPRSRCSSSMRLRICACTETSSAEVGSSQITSSGSSASARDADALALTPGVLAGIGREIGAVEADVGEQLAHPFLAALPPAAVRPQRLADDLAQGEPRVARIIGSRSAYGER